MKKPQTIAYRESLRFLQVAILPVFFDSLFLAPGLRLHLHIIYQSAAR